MAQQTAVEWLVNQEISLDLGSGIEMKIPIPQNVIDKAKQIEKEQICDAFDKGKWDTMAFKGTLKEQYYNQTYGTE